VVRKKSSDELILAGSSDLYKEGDSRESLRGILTTLVEEKGLSKADCAIVLPSSDYQMLLVEKPEVPDDELSQAIRWKVKDLIQEPIDSVVIDTFELPNDASKSKAMLYVVIAPLEKVNNLIALVSDVGLVLKTIDVDVLALRNLIIQRKTERAAALVRLAENGGDVSIYKGDQLYLSRHFNLSYGGGLLEDLPNSDLALEVQRSFDYFERQMGQVPPATLFICGEGVGEEKITDELRKSISAKVEFFDLVASSDVFEPGVLQQCIAAVGATYRQEVA
jgi:MSHA biogenesis protein MshI